MIRPDSRFWFPAFTFVATFLAIPVVSYMGVNALYVTPVAAVLSSMFFLIFDNLTNTFMQNYNFRTVFDKKRSQFEGEWIEYYKGKNKDGVDAMFYAYFRIRYTGRENDPYLIKGNAYDAEGGNFAWWASQMAKFDGNKGIIDYFYFGYFFGRQYSVRGIANLSFDDSTSYVNLPSKPIHDPKSPHRTSYNSGTGHYVDSSAGGAEQNKFHFLRVTDKLVVTLLGKIKVEGVDAEREFIIEFHKKYGKEIFDKGHFNLAAGYSSEEQK